MNIEISKNNEKSDGRGVTKCSKYTTNKTKAFLFVDLSSKNDNVL